MIEKTFCHIKGISPAAEKLLWENGIHTWDRFLSKKAELSHLSQAKKDAIESELILSQKALSENNLKYFKELLNPKEHWRLASYGKIAFVDIETTGLSKWTDQITILGIYDGTTPYIYVNGKDLPKAKEKLKEFDIIVTFNGKQFDLPFIEHYFSYCYDFIHLDLRYLLKELGHQGGLKLIEKKLGITRSEEAEGVDGFEAVRLWNRFKRGDAAALHKLLEYNKADIVNLEALLKHYLKEKTSSLGSTWI